MNTISINYNPELYDYIRKSSKNDLELSIYNLKVLGKGATGETFTANIKPIEKFPKQLVLKALKRNIFCTNEYNALMFLREKMIEKEIPNYFIFMYGCLSSGPLKYIILEKADKLLFDHMTEFDLSESVYQHLFYQIADAVSYLEKLEFNHGDLWIENVMLNWVSEEEFIEEQNRKFNIILIDYDSSFKNKSQINNPSYGGSNKFRNKFILGYDLNRFFDSLIFSYKSYLSKKLKEKTRKINKLKKKQKQNPLIVIPNITDRDEIDEEWDRENVIYPPKIIEYMYSLKINDLDNFKDYPSMSGESIKNNLNKFFSIGN